MDKIKIIPGDRNLISDVDGILVGNAEDDHLQTGLTYLKLEKKFSASAYVFGGASASREIDLLQPERTIRYIDGISLSGGSVFGLSAGSEYVDILSEENRGFKIKDSTIPIPIIPCASIYDLGDKDNKSINSELYRNLAKFAFKNANKNFILGNIGAGIGAKAGIFKGGLGSASINIDSKYTIGAITIINSLGSPFIDDTGILYSGFYEMNGEMGGNINSNHKNFAEYIFNYEYKNNTKLRRDLTSKENTTISVIATDIDLNKLDLYKIAKMCTSGLSRAIKPIGTPMDGDIIFVISSNEKKINIDDYNLTQIGSLASDTLTRAIGRGVFSAIQNIKN
ncbi:MAG: P1 family peptidase [Rhizobiales bacterium]|nr:P1 family peptidase [Hyphomicrobiales bacterium]MBL6770145.1 P1 family peptidase [Hyphomicrobiales bacterium]